MLFIKLQGKIKNINRDLSVIFTPGHDQSEISIHDSKSKVIFSGDHILPRITPFIPTIDSESNLLNDFIISLEKIESIELSESVDLDNLDELE